jgi:hypothetical protein
MRTASVDFRPGHPKLCPSHHVVGNVEYLSHSQPTTSKAITDTHGARRAGGGRWPGGQAGALDVAARTTAEEFRPQPGGTLLICGGGRVPDNIRRRFCQRAGGADARIVIIPARHIEHDSNAERRCLAAWTPYGVDSFELLSVERHEFADDPNIAAPLRRATGVWLDGGDQNWRFRVCCGGKATESTLDLAR